ncbi:MAG: crotonase/enoyl-CoA hydratase family protein [Gammaproteobacteria bacterium]|jgi:DSF synthase
MSSKLSSILSEYKQLTIRYDQKDKAIWYYLNPNPRPCFTPTLLNEIREFQVSIANNYEAVKPSSDHPVNYLVLASQTPNTFNLGGDLNLFAQHILDQNRDHLFTYAKACIAVLYENAVNLSLPITTVSLVEGTALGGGFEAALSSNVLIAERSSELGLPEILFNLFPGMGAYSLLARRVGTVEAEKLITSGKVYSAAELYDMGVVDVLAEDGKGKEAVSAYIKKHSRARNGMLAVHAARQRFHPITYEELKDITEIWVDAALNLERKDLRMMERLVQAQDRRRIQSFKDSNSVLLARTKQDRRMETTVSFPLLDSNGATIAYERRKSTDRRTMSTNSHIAKAANR